MGHTPWAYSCKEELDNFEENSPPLCPPFAFFLLNV